MSSQLETNVNKYKFNEVEFHAFWNRPRLDVIDYPIFQNILI